MSFSFFMRHWRGLKKRFQLWRISRQLGLRLYPWQRDFALGRTYYLDYAPVRGAGKTTAVMLRLLLMDRANNGDAACILACDPDWNPCATGASVWYEMEYNRLREHLEHGPTIDFVRISSKWMAGGARGKFVRFKPYYTGGTAFRCSVCGGICDRPSAHGNRWHSVVGVWGEEQKKRG